MPRRKSMYLPGYPYHIVQRGDNREVCFVESENYQFYLELQKAYSVRHGIAVHAYCLMTNHIYFLVTPEEEDSISRARRVICSRSAYYFNKTNKRSGTIWEGRHKSSLLQSDRYLLTCSRYIEMNPVVAGMAQKPEQYKWSSYLVNAWGMRCNLIPHHEYLRLGNETDMRCRAYRELFRYQIPEHDVHLIENVCEYCHPVGNDRFRCQIKCK